MKRVLSVILSLVMILGILPLGCLEVFAADTGNVVYVNGKKMSSSLTRLKCGDGYADFDAATNTLLLTDCTIKERACAEFDGTVIYAAIISENDLTVEVEGINRVLIDRKVRSESINAAIYADSDLDFCGCGQLLISHGVYESNNNNIAAIFSNGNISFSQTEIICWAEGDGVKCDGLNYVENSANPGQPFFTSVTGKSSCAAFSGSAGSSLNGKVYRDTYEQGSYFGVFPVQETSKENPWQVHSAEELAYLLRAPLDTPMYLQLANNISSNVWDTVDVYGTKTVDLNGFDIYGYLKLIHDDSIFTNILELNDEWRYLSKDMFCVKQSSNLTFEDSTGNNGEVFYDSNIPDGDTTFTYETDAYHFFNFGTIRDLFDLDGGCLTINSGIYKAGRKKVQYWASKAKNIDAVFYGSIVDGVGSFTSNGGIYTFNSYNDLLSDNNRVTINDGIFTFKSHYSRGLFDCSEDCITLNGGKFISEKLGTYDPNGEEATDEATLHIREDYFDFKDNADYFYNGRQITEYTDDLLNKRGTFEIKPKINGELRISAPDNAEKYNNEYYYAQNSSFVITPTAFPKFYTDGVCSEFEHTYYEYTVTDTANPAVTYTTNTSAATFNLGSISSSQFRFEKGHTYSVICSYHDYYQGTREFDLSTESINEILIHISNAVLPSVTGHSVEATFYRSASTDTKRGMATLTVSDCGDFDGGSCELLFYPKAAENTSLAQPITGNGKYIFNYQSNSEGLATYAYEIRMYDKNGYPTFSSKQTFNGATGPWIYISTSGYNKPLIDGKCYIKDGLSVRLATEKTLAGSVTYQWYKRSRNADGSYASSAAAVSGATANNLTVTSAGKYYLRIQAGGFYATSNVITIDTPQTTSDLCVTVSSSANSCSKTSPATLTATAYNVNTAKSVTYEWKVTQAPEGFGYTLPYTIGSGTNLTTRTFPFSGDLSAYPPGNYEITCKIMNDGKEYTSVPVKVQLIKTPERIETYYNGTCFTDGDTLYMPSQEKSITVFSAPYPREITDGYNISYQLYEGNSVTVTADAKSCAVITPVHPGTSKIKVYIKDQNGNNMAVSTITVVVPVSVFDVYVNQPMVRGGTLEKSDITVISTYLSSLNRYWYMGGSIGSALADGTVIQANNRYSAGVKMVLRSGYYLPTKNPKTQDPQTDAVGTTDCIKIRWHTDPQNTSSYIERVYDGPSSGTSYYVYEIFDFDTVKDKTCAYFDEIECRFISPDAGTPANAFGSCFTFSSPNFRQSAAVIWDETAGRRLVTGSTAFIEGHTYSAGLYFETTGEDLYFSDSLEVTINGQPFGAQLSFNSAEPDTIELTEQLTFTCGVKEYDYIYDVKLSGVETPAAGTEAPLIDNVHNNGTIAADTDELYVTKVEWYSNGNNWNDFLDGKFFKPNTVYKARIWVEVNTDDYPTYRLYKVNSTPWLKVAGQYYATAYVNGAQTKGYVEVTFPATGELTVLSVSGSTQRTWSYKEGCFTAAEAAVNAYTVTVINHTANTFTNLSVDLKDGDDDCFTVNQPAKRTLGAYEQTSFRVVPKHDLTGGAYLARYELNYDGGETVQFAFGINVEERDWNYLSGIIELEVENKDDYDYMELITVTLTPQGETEPVITQKFVGFDAQTYRLSNITPGVYTLKAEHEGSISYTQTVDITNDAEQNIYIPLTGNAGNSVFGIVSYCGWDDSPVVFSYKRSTGGQAVTREFSTAGEYNNYTGARKTISYCLTEIGFASYKIVVSKAEHVDRNIVVSVTRDTTLSTSLNKINDINGSGETDVADYSACVNYALSEDTQVNSDQTADADYEKRVADTNNDGYVDVLDCAAIERALYN